jgi:alpha-beta hydrolase superfamily lysophospholipase
MFKLIAALIWFPMAGLAQTEVMLTAADGVQVFADHYAHEGPDFRGTILLFHQADSNAAEYKTIAPRLAALGFDALAVDQRSGGNMFLGVNRTAAAVGRGLPYEAALPDMEAALDYATALTPGGPVIAWGSSYSAGLVIVLAAQNPGRLAGVLAFSPGEYFAGLSVAHEAAQLTMPVYLTASGTEREMAEVTAIAAAVPAGLATVVTPIAGRHGSSTLIQSYNQGGWTDNWLPVEAFLAVVAP